MNIEDLSAGPTKNITMRMPIAMVLQQVNFSLPIDATVTAIHFDAATYSLELVIASDFFKERTPNPDQTIK